MLLIMIVCYVINNSNTMRYVFFQCRHSRHSKNVDMLGDFIVLRGPMESIVDKLAGYY